MDIQYMQRALQLALSGEGHVSPNPMVGAVIVADNRIIGEGYHRKFGAPHAEVNAIASVAPGDLKLLKKSRIYVTLEPCCHHGKTPPCADLIIQKEIPVVVLGALDPNPLVAGKGVKKLIEAGVEVIEGVMTNECEALNPNFFTSHTLHRPRIILKWAQSADGFMAGFDSESNPVPVKFSNRLSTVWMHRHRSVVDAITVGTNTLKIDSPRLDVRHWTGKNPLRIEIKSHIDPHHFVSGLYGEGITSLIVEGGPTLLKSFINENLFDEIRIETATFYLHKGLRSPSLPEGLKLVSSTLCRGNIIATFRR